MALNPLFEQDEELDDQGAGGNPDGDPPAGDPPAGDPPAADPPKDDPPKNDPPKIDPPGGTPNAELDRRTDERVATMNKAARTMRAGLREDYPELTDNDIDDIVDRHLELGADYMAGAVNNGSYKEFAKTIAYDRQKEVIKQRQANAGGQPDRTPVGSQSPRPVGGSQADNLQGKLESGYKEFGKPTKAMQNRLRQEFGDNQ